MTQVTLDLDEAHDFSLLWQRLRACSWLGLPLGCATAHDPQLREVGLCGSHAYSILEVREARARSGGPAVRLVRIRNPHGVGEWTGAWSDKSAEWAQLLGSEARDLERTGVNDGTFWMELTHFVMGFALVDVSLAHRGWHARSCQNAFPFDKKSGRRLCASSCARHATPAPHGRVRRWRRAGAARAPRALQRRHRSLRARHAPTHPQHPSATRLPLLARRRRPIAPPRSYLVRCAQPTTFYVLALQPTKRGAWCRQDRKKSYRHGDVSVLIARLSDDGSTLAEIVGYGLRGAERGSRAFGARLARAGAVYIVMPLCLGSPPTAAEISRAAPFVVRFFASEPLEITPVPSGTDAPPLGVRGARGGGVRLSLIHI